MFIASPSTYRLQALALLATAVGFAAPAVAQDQQTVTVVGTVDRVCMISQPVQGQGGVSNFDSPSGTVFAITSLSDPATLTTRAATVTLTMDAMCNGLHRVILASDNNGLWRQGVTTPTPGFASAVPYRANLIWADQQTLLSAEAAPRQSVQKELLIGQPATGEMLIEFSINAGATNAGIGAPLLAGEYSDVLRVTVEPQ